MKNISFLKENGINIEKSLEVFGDIKTYNATIGEFLVGIHSKIKQIINFLEIKDIANYAIIVHSMKNDALNFGFTKLAEVAYEHELKSKAGDLYFVNGHLNNLIEETNKAIILVQEYMNGNEAEQVLENTSITEEELYNRKTILVVDDSNIIRNFVKRIFSDKYNVGVAKNGEEAIKIINVNSNNNLIEAILLDLNMPKVDGFAVLEYMRQNDLLEKFPVSIISGDSSKETIDKAFTYDIVDMLEKPFNEQSVRSIVEKTIYRKDFNNYSTTKE